MGGMEIFATATETGEAIMTSSTIVFVLGIIAVCYVVWLVHPQLTELTIARGGGLRLTMNSVSEFAKIVNKLKWIDAKTARSIRQGTVGLLILDPSPGKYGLRTEVMLVNDEAVDPLVYAAYENNHTKELANEDGNTEDKKYEVYLKNKTIDVYNNIKTWKPMFPEINFNLCDAFVSNWTIEVLLPNLVKASHEKIEFYDNELERKDLSDTTRTMLSDLRQKNMSYIKCFNELLTLSRLHSEDGGNVRKRQQHERIVSDN
jgi:hypothetical protein